MPKALAHHIQARPVSSPKKKPQVWGRKRPSGWATGSWKGTSALCPRPTFRHQWKAGRVGALCEGERQQRKPIVGADLTGFSKQNLGGWGTVDQRSAKTRSNIHGCPGTRRTTKERHEDKDEGLAWSRELEQGRVPCPPLRQVGQGRTREGGRRPCSHLQATPLATAGLPRPLAPILKATTTRTISKNSQSSMSSVRSTPIHCPTAPEFA